MCAAPGLVAKRVHRVVQKMQVASGNRHSDAVLNEFAAQVKLASGHGGGGGFRAGIAGLSKNLSPVNGPAPRRGKGMATDDVCHECGSGGGEGVGGEVDVRDGLFYCAACWDVHRELGGEQPAEGADVEEETAEGGGGQGGRGAGIEGVDGIEAGGAAEEGTDPLAHCRKRSKRKTTGAGAGVKHAGGVLIGSMVGGVNGRGVGDADVEIKLDAVRGSLDRM